MVGKDLLVSGDNNHRKQISLLHKTSYLLPEDHLCILLFSPRLLQVMAPRRETTPKTKTNFGDSAMPKEQHGRCDTASQTWRLPDYRVQWKSLQFRCSVGLDLLIAPSVFCLNGVASSKA